jgi:hypothetical protein
MLVTWFQTKRMRNERQPLWIQSEGICTEVISKEPDYQLTTCSTCTVEGKCGRKMGSTLGPNCGPRARVLLTHLDSFRHFRRQKIYLRRQKINLLLTKIFFWKRRYSFRIENIYLEQMNSSS